MTSGSRLVISSTTGTPIDGGEIPPLLGPGRAEHVCAIAEQWRQADRRHSPGIGQFVPAPTTFRVEGSI